MIHIVVHGLHKKYATHDNDEHAAFVQHDFLAIIEKKKKNNNNKRRRVSNGMEIPIDCCNFIVRWEEVFGKQNALNFIPIYFRRIVSFIAFCAICGIEFIFAFYSVLFTLVFLFIDWQITLGALFVLLYFFFVQLWWKVFVIWLFFVIPVIVASINIALMTLNIAIFIYSMVALVWNMLVPFVGFILYFVFGFIISLFKLAGKFFGGGGNALSAHASARQILGLGDALGGAMDIIMKMLNVLFEIVGEIINAIMQVARRLMEVLATVIGGLISVAMKVVGLFMKMLQFVVRFLFPIISPLIKLIGFFFGKGRQNDATNTNKSKYNNDKSGRSLLETTQEYFINNVYNSFNGDDASPVNLNADYKSLNEGSRPKQPTSSSSRRDETVVDIDHFTGDMMAHNFMHHARDTHRIHPYDEAHGIVEDVLNWHADPVNHASLMEAQQYESHHDKHGWFDPDVSPLSEEEVNFREVKMLPFKVEHEFATEINERKLVLGGFHAMRQTMFAINDHVNSGTLRNDIEKFSQTAGFISAEHMIDHIGDNYDDPMAVIQGLSPSNNEHFMHLARAIDPDAEDRKFFGDYVKNDPRSGPVMKDGKRALMMLDVAIFARTDCYNSDPRNPLCLPEFPKDFFLKPIGFGIKWDLNEDKVCPGWIKSNCIFCFARVNNAIVNIGVWMTVFIFIFIGGTAIFFFFPMFRPIVLWLLPYQIDALPSFRDYLCSYIYTYDVLIVITVVFLYFSFIAPFIKWAIGCIRHWFAHRARMRAWSDEDIERWSFVDPRVLRYIANREVFRKDKEYANRPSTQVRKIKKNLIASSLSFTPSPPSSSSPPPPPPPPSSRRFNGEISTWHRHGKSSLLSNTHPRTIGTEVDTEKDGSPVHESIEYIHCVCELQKSVSRFKRHFSTPVSHNKHYYQTHAIEGKMFGMFHMLEHAFPLHMYSITFVRKVIAVLEEKQPLSVPINVFDRHLHQIVKKPM